MNNYNTITYEEYINELRSRYLQGYSPKSILVDNYIIAHHIGNRIYRLPLYPESVDDAINSTFNQTNILSRSAPLQAWAYSGPRTLSFSLEVHRDLDYEVSGDTTSKIGDINELIDEYQALTLPNCSQPMLIIPPKITIKLGTKLRITGIPTISYTNKLPLDSTGNYIMGVFNFEVKELTPTDAHKIIHSSLHNARGSSRSDMYRW